jgi:glucose dehydrogenase
MKFETLNKAKRLMVAVAGFTILAAGVALIVLPGPAFVVIPIGLALLASEFIWAKRLIAAGHEYLARMGRERK